MRKPAPRTIRNGTTFSATLADGSSLFTVMGKRGADTYDCEVLAHPEHGTQIDWLGTKKVFGGEEIRAAIQYDKALNGLFARADNFWATRRVGEVVHYHNGGGQYVRGTVVMTPKGLQMQATALVGDWPAHELPSRAPDGSVRLSYTVRKIRDGESWSPNDSCMFEATGFSKPMGPKRDFDPRRAPAIDISDPAPLEGEAAKRAMFEKMRMDIQRILSEGYNDPEEALISAYEHLIAGGIK